ncbi:MAG: zinc ribbon domain-containing protein, partial [Candidatus Eremiobacteraeota bacterium]|nr:zinc ribbon domain-containing protein [Candidatus Eremiobacteraeota bacterium]
DGDFDTPAARAIHGVLDLFAEEKIEQDQVLDLFNQVEGALKTQISFIEQLLAEGEADPSNPVHQWIEKGFRRQLEALDYMRGFFDDEDEERIEDGAAMFQEGTNQMMMGYAEFQRMRLEAMQFECPHCGARNLKGSPKCGNCAQKLPHEVVETGLLATVGDGGVKQEASTPNLDAVREALEKWRSGQLSTDELRNEFDQVSARFEAHKADLARERAGLGELSEQERQIMTSLLTNMETALDDSLEAMDAMTMFFATEDPSHLDRGLDRLTEATSRVIEAYEGFQKVTRKAEQDTGRKF